MRKYICTYSSTFEEPYYISGKGDTLCVHKNVESWETTSLATVHNWLKDTLDIPFKELTLEQIHEDFDDDRFGPLPEDRAKAIMEYYNGRLALHETIVDDLKDASNTNIKYDIPEKFNTFWVYGEKDKTRQVDAFISIEAKDEEEQA